MTDREVTERVRCLLEAGDSRGAATLVIEALGPSALALLHALHDPDDAEDVFADFELAVWRGLPGFRFEGSLRAWTMRVARNASHHFWRDPWRARRVRLRTSAASRLGRSSATGHLRPAVDERIEALRAELEPADRELLALRAQRELTWDEIAAELSADGQVVSAPALRKRYERLKARLEKLARGKGMLP
jgi:RNA polymerase sigma-70 factor (ECF subfamily)